MNLKKLALGVIAVVAVLVAGYYIQQNRSNARKICSPIDGRMVCQKCSCPMGQPIPSLDSVACPDGAKPTCQQEEN